MTTINKATLDKLLEGIDPDNPQAMFTDPGLFGQEGYRACLLARLVRPQPLGLILAYTSFCIY